MKNYELALICKDAYKFSTFSKCDVEVLVKYYDNLCVIAVRGTEARDLWTQRDNFRWRDMLKRKQWKNWFGGITDIARDLMAWPKYSPELNAYFHAGFLKGAEHARDEILSGKYDITKLTPLIITGHSLGGGIALPLALLLKKERAEVQSCVVFGCPRAVRKNSEFVFKDLHVASYRYGNDFVTTVPKRGWGYSHPVPLLQLGNSTGRKPNWSDHSIDLYISALKPKSK